MAILHRGATLTPSKPELLGAWLATQDWAPAGDVRPIGAYRLDDRDGEVGIEGHLLDVGGTTLHVPVTYRNAPLEGAEAALVGTMEHSALGRRWVYDAAADPVALRELATAALAGAAGAELILVDADRREVDRIEPVVRVQGSGSADPATVDAADYDVAIMRVPADAPADAGEATLAGRWDGGEAVLATVRRR
jgi:hypothetical protein